jgi:hypothetical protein
MILIRFLLIGLIGYLITRSFIRFGKEEKSSTKMTEPGKKNEAPVKKVSKKIGDYIDYEELKK